MHKTTEFVALICFVLKLCVLIFLFSDLQTDTIAEFKA